MTPHDLDDGRAAYELRINGLLGPVLLGVLPHATASRAHRHTLRVTVDEGAELLDVLQAIVDTGVEVDAVREVSSTHDEPEPT